MKIIKKNSNIVQLSALAPGEVFQWSEHTYMVVKQSAKTLSGVEIVNLQSGLLDALPPSTEVTTYPDSTIHLQ